MANTKVLPSPFAQDKGSAAPTAVPETPPTLSELLAATGKFTYDAVLARVEEMITTAVTPLVRELEVKSKALAEAESTLAGLKATYESDFAEIKGTVKRDSSVAEVVGKMLKKELDGDVASVMQTHEDHVKTLQAANETRVRAIAESSAKAMNGLRTELREELRKNAEDMRADHATQLAEAHKQAADQLAAEIIQSRTFFDTRLTQLHNYSETMFGGLRSLISDLLTKLPEQLRPTVNMTVPEPVVNITLPEQIAPVVNIAVPDQPAPTIFNTLTLPPRRSVKSIAYDAMSRPVQIEEHEVDADQTGTKSAEGTAD